MDAVAAWGRTLQGSESAEDRAASLQTLLRHLETRQVSESEVASVRGFFAAPACSFSQAEQEAVLAALPPTVAEQQGRRGNQDFTKFYLFLSQKRWQSLQVLVGLKSKAEYVGDFCHGLGMQLPTEQTLAMMTAVICALLPEEQTLFQLHSAYVCVKSCWKSAVKRYQKALRGRTPPALLAELPGCIRQLPVPAQEFLSSEEPASVSTWPVSEETILNLYGKIPLRSSHTAVNPTLERRASSASCGSGPDVAAAIGGALLAMAQGRSFEEPGLPGLRTPDPGPLQPAPRTSRQQRGPCRSTWLWKTWPQRQPCRS